MDDTDRAILELEDRFHRRASSDEAAIRTSGLSSTPFAERLDRLVDDPAAMAEFPQLVAALRRSRTARSAQPLPRRAS